MKTSQKKLLLQLLIMLFTILFFYHSSIAKTLASSGSSDDTFIDTLKVNTVITDSLSARIIRAGNNSIFIGGFLQPGNDNITSNNPSMSFGRDPSTLLPFNNISIGIGTTAPNFVLDVDNNINVTPSAPNNGYRIDGIPVLQKPGTNNIFVGEGAGFNNMGTDNTFVGFNAGLGNNTHIENTFIGSQTGINNASAAGTFLGFRAGNANTTGTCNTFLGWEAGESTTIGSKNVFIGGRAGGDNVFGLENVYIDVYALGSYYW